MIYHVLNRTNTNDFLTFLGFSCFDPMADIEYAKRNRICVIELRRNIINLPLSELEKAIISWRKVGGHSLSIHISDLIYDDGFKDLESFFAICKMAKVLDADMVTFHTPKVSVKDMKDKEIFRTVVDKYIQAISYIPEKCMVAVENMHTENGVFNDTRRFGTLPEECVSIMNAINQTFAAKRCGIRLDIGHGRNNPPFCERYTLASWYNIVGKHTIGYHIHQVVEKDGVITNHHPINSPDGLCSYYSFINAWSSEIINHAPVIIEVKGEEGREASYNTFNKLLIRERK